jgi:hypothetical protein
MSTITRRLACAVSRFGQLTVTGLDHIIINASVIFVSAALPRPPFIILESVVSRRGFRLAMTCELAASKSGPRSERHKVAADKYDG